MNDKDKQPASTVNWLDYAEDFHEGKALVRKGDDIFYINRDGNDVFPSLRFERAKSFSDGYALVIIRGRIGYLDHSGTIATGKGPVILDSTDFSEGRAFLKYENETGWVCVDKLFNELFTLEGLEPVDSYTEGFARVKRVRAVPGPESSCEEFMESEESGGPAYEYNYIDGDGRLLSEEWYAWAHRFSEGLAVVYLGDEYHYGYNYMDTQGCLLSERGFAHAFDFSEGLGAVALEGDEDGPSFSHCYVDRNGQLVMPLALNNVIGCRYNRAFPFSEDAACIGWQNEDSFDGHFIDHSGKELFSFFYDSKYMLFGFKEGFAGFAAVSCDFEFELEEQFFVDRQGRNAFDKSFDEISPFSGGMAVVVVDDRYNYIDRNGEYLIK